MVPLSLNTILSPLLVGNHPGRFLLAVEVVIFSLLEVVISAFVGGFLRGVSVSLPKVEEGSDLLRKRRAPLLPHHISGLSGQRAAGSRRDFS